MGKIGLKSSRFGWTISARLSWAKKMANFTYRNYKPTCKGEITPATHTYKFIYMGSELHLGPVVGWFLLQAQEAMVDKEKEPLVWKAQLHKSPHGFQRHALIPPKNDHPSKQPIKTKAQQKPEFFWVCWAAGGVYRLGSKNLGSMFRG